MTEPKPEPQPRTEPEPRTGAAPCSECGRDAADTAMPRPAWNSWRRVLPIVLLALATGYVVLMTMPFSRVWITGHDNGLDYAARYNSKPGFELGIHPHLVTPASLRAMAGGHGSVDELRAMVDEFATTEQYGAGFRSVPTQMMLCVGTRHARVDERTKYGFPFAYFDYYRGQTWDDYFDRTPEPPPLTHSSWSFSLVWSKWMRNDDDDRRFEWWGVSPLALAAAAGLGWFVWSVARRCSRRRSVRWAAMLAYGAAMGVGAGYSQTTIDLSDFTSSQPTLSPMGVTLDGFLAARESESGLRGLARAMAGAIPEGSDDNGVVYLGHLTPVASDWWQESLGPILYPYGFGYYGGNSYFRYDASGNRLEPAEVSILASARYVGDVVIFYRGKGNEGSHLALYPAMTVLFLTLLAMIYSIPRRLFALAARRRHRTRLRLGLCAGCGYRSLTR